MDATAWEIGMDTSHLGTEDFIRPQGSSVPSEPLVAFDQIIYSLPSYYCLYGPRYLALGPCLFLA